MIKSLIPSKLRTRILILGLLVTVPALTLTYLSGVEHRHFMANQFEADALRLANLAAASQSRIAEGAHQLLAALAQVPESLIGGHNCDRLLEEILSGQTLYANLAVADLNGDLYCSALPMSNPVNISDRTYFRRALASGGFAIGDYQIGRLTGVPTLNFAHVVRDESGSVRAVVIAAFDLAYFNRLPSDLDLPPGTTLSVIDSQGTILARYPGAERWTGESLPESFPLESMLEGGEGTLEATGLDGVARVYGFTRLIGAPIADPVFVRIGIPTAIAYEESSRQLIQNLAAMGLVSVLALAALWVGSDIFILRGTRALLAATRRLADGDLSARSGLPESGGEVGELAQAFDQMAASLAERQAALVRAESQYRALVEHVPSAIYTMELGENPTGTYVSPQILDLTGRTPGEWLADPYTWLNEILADDRQAVLDEYMRAYRAGAPFHAEYRVVRTDGEIVWLRDQASVVRRPGGGRYLLGVLNDVTDRKRAEEALRGSEERYRKLVEQLPAIVYVYDHTAEHRTTYISPQVETLLGYTQAEWIARPELWAELMHPEDRPQVMSQVAAADQQGLPLDVQYRLVARTGQTLWFHTLSQIVVDADGVPLYSMGVMNDITRLKEAEAAERRQRALAEALRDTAESLSASLRLDEVLDRVLANVHRVLPHDAATIMLIEGDISRVVRARGYAERGLEDMALALRLSVSETYNLRRMREEGRAIVVPDLSNFPEWVRHEPSVWQQSYIGVPIRAKGQVIGFLNLESGKQGFFRPQDAEQLQALADQAGQAIENARLFEDAQMRLGQLQALRTIDGAITASVDVRLSLKVLLDQVVGQLHVDAADVLILNRHSRALEFMAGAGFTGTGHTRAEVRLGDSYAGKAALERRPFVMPDMGPHLDEFNRGPLFASEGFVSYFAVPLIAKGRTTGVLEVFRRSRFEPPAEWMAFLETLAGQAAIAIDNAALFEEVSRSNLELTLAYDTTLEGWSRALDLRDRETEGHSQRVTEMTLRVARRMGVPETEQVHLRRGSLLHDIGKMGIPDGILLKPGPLTDEEWQIMRRHPRYAYDMLLPIAFLRPALDIPFAHHERWDGSGYPQGLRGEEIPLGARIFAVVDVWDALSSDRPYRRAWPRQEVLAHLRQGGSVHFDPRVLEVFLEELARGEAPKSGQFGTR